MTLLLVLGVLAIVGVGYYQTNKLHRFLDKHKSKTKHLPRAIGLLITVAQISELSRVVEHISIVHVAAALFLLAVLLATRSGAESELL